MSNQKPTEWSWQDNDERLYRKVVFVKYPASMTVEKIDELLNWSKWRHPEKMTHEHILVRCGVKPPYYQHFLDDNKTYIVPHTLIIHGENICYEVEESLYD